MAYPLILENGVLKELGATTALQVGALASEGPIVADQTPSAGSESIIGSEKISLGLSANSFINIRKSATNQWHAHPNDLMFDTTGKIQIGDPQEFGNKTHIEVDDTNLLIHLHNHAGAIEIGDTEDLGNSLLFTVRDDVRRFIFSNGDDATPAGIEFPDAGGGVMIGTGAAELFAFWGATPIVRPSTSVAAASFTANSGTAVNDASTFDGYTLKQVVKALRNIGLLA